MVGILEIFGESFGNPGNFMGISGIPRESRESHGNPGNPVGIPGIPWESWESRGNPGNLVGILGIPWESWESRESRESGIRRFPLETDTLRCITWY